MLLAYTELVHEVGRDVGEARLLARTAVGPHLG